MNRTSQTEAWARISACADVNAGRLTGRVLRYQYLSPILPGSLTPDAARQLHASVYRSHTAPADPDTIWYVVSSDGTPVAWLTLAATVVTPPADLTDYQRRHQQQAVAALSQLTRQALLELARLRDTREQRTPGGLPQTRPDSRPDSRPADADTGTWILVADPADPTLTFRTRVTADLPASRLHIAEITGLAEGSDALILDVHGYGDYGRNRAWLRLPMLCTVERLAAEHHLTAATIGTWLDLAGASAADPTPGTVTAAFRDDYAGIHENRHAFAIAERDRYGWTTAFATAGIPDRYFNLDAFTEHLFRADVHKVDLGDGRIAVFRRA
ncbi:hypothetical protein ABZS66_28090 [Dactylosporangium sp. NPDC005572]|uniref:hypothetical protein n=1 Tax=Dactylosporangium sp. NPDC005572 TaxID=3156889 RepID=UPI0033A972FF